MDFTDAHKGRAKLKTVANHTRTLFDAFMPETDLDVTAVKVARG